jgi:hypothetical protein
MNLCEASDGLCHQPFSKHALLNQIAKFSEFAKLRQKNGLKSKKSRVIYLPLALSFEKEKNRRLQISYHS